VSYLIEVAFKGNRKEFFLWEPEEAPPLRAPVIVDADRGEDVGTVHSVGELAEGRSARVPHGLFGAPATHIAKRLASPDDVRRLAEIRTQDDDARRRAMERVKANALVMKVTDAEWQWDRKKLTLYFTAEKRVDFRTLVRELASMFRTRIELKQIGVRDEAKRLDGYGRCGRQYCSASWLPELRPVNLGVAKDQRLSLNPSQISGACGRLMCCLRYEHEFYVTTRRRFPKEGKVLKTAKGEEKVVSNDLFRERVTLRGEEGESRVVTLEELRAELDTLGIPFPAPGGAPAKTVAEPQDESEMEDSEASLADAELVATAEPADGPAAAGQEQPAQAQQAAERRRGRRRGRRGGRRGRQGPEGSSPQSPDSSSPQSPDSSSPQSQRGSSPQSPGDSSPQSSSSPSTSNS
jgi:cell fate regulator YaaT (PSP1 superfamily)